MKIQSYNLQTNCLRHCYLSSFVYLLLMFFVSCTGKQEPYSLLEFSGVENVNNYSKSYMLVSNKSDSIHPTAIMGSKGDLFSFDEYLFVYDGSPTKKIFSLRYDDSALYVNNKISMIDIPDSNTMIPWFKSIRERDLSTLQFLKFDSEIPEIYLPQLATIADIRPDAGIFCDRRINDLAELLKIFNPRYIIGPKLFRNSYDKLSGLTNLELLMVQPADSIIDEPLPLLPSLKQIFIIEWEGDVDLTNDFLKNNRQIEKVIMNISGNVDLALLNPLENLKELVVMGFDSIINYNLINSHNKLEVLSLVGDDQVYNPDLFQLPALRWMTFSSEVTQSGFDAFVKTHSNLEIIEIIDNDTITNLQSLSKLGKLKGLTLTESVVDSVSIKALHNLKYLSLPDDFMERNKAELQESLPDTHLVANEGFCLGSGWLLLLIPLVLIIRFFGSIKRRQPNRMIS
jgi:hypothetical protein